MFYSIDKNKKAVKDLSIFEGLEVENKEFCKNMFLRADHYAVEVWGKKGLSGHVVFSIIDSDLIFKLIKVNNEKEVTKSLLNNFLIPFCKKNKIKTIIAKAERKGMHKKLKDLKFTKDSISKRYYFEV